MFVFGTVFSAKLRVAVSLAKAGALLAGVEAVAVADQPLIPSGLVASTRTW